jgi:hypothetical protein
MGSTYLGPRPNSQLEIKSGHAYIDCRQPWTTPWELPLRSYSSLPSRKEDDTLRGSVNRVFAEYE